MHSGEQSCLTVFLLTDICNTERDVIHQNPSSKLIVLPQWNVALSRIIRLLSVLTPNNNAWHMLVMCHVPLC